MINLENNFFKIKMIITIVNPYDIDVPLAEYIVPFFMNKDEYAKLTEGGDFDVAYWELLDSYKTYFSRHFQGCEVILGFDLYEENNKG